MNFHHPSNILALQAALSQAERGVDRCIDKREADRFRNNCDENRLSNAEASFTRARLALMAFLTTANPTKLEPKQSDAFMPLVGEYVKLFFEVETASIAFLNSTQELVNNSDVALERLKMQAEVAAYNLRRALKLEPCPCEHCLRESKVSEYRDTAEAPAPGEEG